MKIDPKAIGVGQYQHDMPQARLDETLSGVVEDCVNAVGADLNTASAPLLARVAGLNQHHRQKRGGLSGGDTGPSPPGSSCLKVPKLGPKAFEQCAGFLRVPESRRRAGSHRRPPGELRRRRGPARACAATACPTVTAGGAGRSCAARVAAYGEEKAAQACGVGVPTLRDIVGELMKPGRDPRDELPRPILRTDVLEMKDLKPGMELTGTVRNVIDFGVFVDIGVHQDGLVHISQLREGRRVQHPSEVCAVGDIVTVWVLEVDEKKKRISLTMRKPK